VKSSQNAVCEDTFPEPNLFAGSLAAREIDRQVAELRRATEICKATADRNSRRPESGYFALALESLDRFEALLVLANSVSSIEGEFYELGRLGS
jgi:hypothetical protein